MFDKTAHSLAVCRPEHGGLSEQEIKGALSTGVRGNLSHCLYTYCVYMYTYYIYYIYMYALGEKPGFLGSLGCRDPVIQG